MINGLYRLVNLDEEVKVAEHAILSKDDSGTDRVNFGSIVIDHGNRNPLFTLERLPGKLTFKLHVTNKDAKYGLKLTSPDDEFDNVTGTWQLIEGYDD